MAWWEALVLGLVQGLAEFLPVSSSGHLVLGQYLLGVREPDITFEVFVHFGTVLSIVTVYWRRIGTILREFFRALAHPAQLRAALRPGPIEHTPPEPLDAESRTAPPSGAVRLALFVLLSMVPTGVVYVLFADTLEGLFEAPRFVCGMLLVTGVLLLLIRFRPHPDGHFSAGKALLAGLAQSAALVPGISRSGSTISTAIYLNVDRKDAADFSFLMSLPVIVGATGLKVLDLFGAGAETDWLPLVLGTVVAYASGIWAIRVVIAFVQRGDLQYFAYYCFAAGTLGLLFIQ
ncbi:MAG: undecaprenyl-diphosphate phosphatase [Bacteroidota bacterium]